MQHERGLVDKDYAPALAASRSRSAAEEPARHAGWDLDVACQLCLSREPRLVLCPFHARLEHRGALDADAVLDGPSWPRADGLCRMNLDNGTRKASESRDAIDELLVYGIMYSWRRCLHPRRRLRHAGV